MPSPLALPALPRRSCRRWFASLAVALTLLPGAHAQPKWPERPVRIVVPYAAGGNTDAIARLASERLTNAFGTQFIVDNRAGAGGAIAAEFVSKAAPDGYTLFVAALSQFGPVPLTQKVNYNPLKDFAPISNIGANGFVIATHSSVPVKTIREFIDYVKARPNQLNYGSGGSGSLTHLAAALFLQRAGVQMVHVPYKGGAPALADTLAGQVQMYAGSPSELIPHAKTGKINLLGISSSQRNAQLPDVPTIAETLPGFKSTTWNGLLAPAGTPQPVINAMAAEMAKAFKDPVFLDKLARLGLDPVPGSPQEFGDSIRGDYAMWRDVIKSVGLTIE
jgi:tripartite-type tricarboxylate transporter receptor subunit TctC